MSNIFTGTIKASEIKAGEISFTAKEAAELQQYRQIGTIEECREARQRQEPIFEHENEFPF